MTYIYGRFIISIVIKKFKHEKRHLETEYDNFTDLKDILKNIINDPTYKEVLTREKSDNQGEYKYHWDAGLFSKNKFFQVG